MRLNIRSLKEKIKEELQKFLCARDEIHDLSYQ
jgi:hypothetical protein